MTVFAGDPINASDINNASPIMVRKSADEVAPVSSAAVQDDDQLFVSVEANAVYFVTGWLRYISVSNVPDLRLNYSYPAGAVFARSDWGSPSSTTAIPDTVDVGVATSGDNGRGAGTVERSIFVMGELTTSATAGTFKVRFGQVTSSTDTVTMRAGSRIVLQKYA
jgi:hypothetical protein